MASKKAKKVININPVFNEAIGFLSDNIDNIADIIVLVETKDGLIRYINTTESTDFLYLANRKVQEDLNYRNQYIYEDEVDFVHEWNNPY